MRRYWLLSLLAAVACGGGSDTSVTPPAPPTGPGPAASVTLREGDGQSGEPQQPLAVAPSVIVRDAAGKAVPGVPVTFAVDSGRGTVTSGSVTSNSDGVATAGTWTLGPVEGRHVASARSGALSSVKFIATATIAKVTYPPQAVSVAGGTVKLVRPGRSLDGFEVQVPANALSSPSTIALTVRSAAALQLPVGVAAGTPIVRIDAGAARLLQPVLLRFPVRAEVGRTRVASMRMANGSLSALPTVTGDADGITVALWSLSAEGVAAAGTVASRAGAARDGSSIEVLVQQVDDALFNKDFDSGFRPGVDDWDFVRQPIAGVAAMIDPVDAMLATSLWYWKARKSTDGPLYQRF